MGKKTFFVIVIVAVAAFALGGGHTEHAANELVDYAVAKGTPVLEKTASAIREKAIVVTKDVLTKLESKK